MVEGIPGARHMVVGDDFRYGSKACGSIESLRAAGRARGFGVEEIAPFLFGGVRVTSTAVRERLEHADYAGAARFWGAPTECRPRGARPGARPELGFPTANLHLMRRKSPTRGISAVRVYGIERSPSTESRDLARVPP